MSGVRETSERAGSGGWGRREPRATRSSTTGRQEISNHHGFITTASRRTEPLWPRDSSEASKPPTRPRTQRKRRGGTGERRCRKQREARCEARHVADVCCSLPGGRSRTEGGACAEVWSGFRVFSPVTPSRRPSLSAISTGRSRPRPHRDLAGRDASGRHTTPDGQCRREPRDARATDAIGGDAPVTIKQPTGDRRRHVAECVSRGSLTAGYAAGKRNVVSPGGRT